jgi:hypothetical protein
MLGAVANSNSHSCSGIEMYRWRDVGNQNTCWIAGSISFSSPGYKINSSRDETVTGFIAQSLKNMFYLPDSPYEIFPYLQAYSSRGSAVKEISAANFKKLKKLRLLYLDQNQIEKINSDTFNDLESLEWLNLGMHVHHFIKGLLTKFFL